jgi:WD40 repeat protein
MNRHGGIQRRHLLALGAGLLAGCGGGGGDTPAGNGGGGGGGGCGNAVPSGKLVFTNSSMVAVWDFATASGVEFDPGDMDNIGGGVTATPDGTLATMLEGDNQSFSFATFDLAGQRTGLYELRRELAFQTSVLAFNAQGSRIAFSLNEIASPSDDTRVDRTWVAEWPSGNLLRVLEGWEDPVWAGPGDELIVRHPESNQLRLFDAALQDQGWIADLVAQPDTGSFAVSPDGRYIVLEDGPRIRVYDRTNGARWVATERISNVFSPCFSPDGRFLAVHAIDLTTATVDFFTRVPHIVPFVPGTTIAMDENTRRVHDSLAFTTERMAWLP